MTTRSHTARLDISFPALQVGAPLVMPLSLNSGDDNEDRKRLKEKLKTCMANAL